MDAVHLQTGPSSLYYQKLKEEEEGLDLFGEVHSRHILPPDRVNEFRR